MKWEIRGVDEDFRRMRFLKVTHQKFMIFSWNYLHTYCMKEMPASCPEQPICSVYIIYRMLKISLCKVGLTPMHTRGENYEKNSHDI